VLHCVKLAHVTYKHNYCDWKIRTCSLFYYCCLFLYSNWKTRM